MKQEKQKKTASARRQNKRRPAAHTVHFELTYPSATKVCVAGTFNNWKPEAGELTRLDGEKWVKDLTLKPGTYEYRLVVDGQWLPDPQADHSVLNPFGEKNSLLTIQ